MPVKMSTPSLKGNVFSDSMLKYLPSENGDFKYELFVRRGHGIEIIDEILQDSSQESTPLFIHVSFGINNILNGCTVNNIMLLYENCFHNILNVYPQTVVLVHSLSHVTYNLYQSEDHPANSSSYIAGINKSVDDVNDALKSRYGSQGQIRFVDLKLPKLDGVLYDRSHMSLDGLHFSPTGLQHVADVMLAHDLSVVENPLFLLL